MLGLVIGSCFIGRVLDRICWISAVFLEWSGLADKLLNYLRHSWIFVPCAEVHGAGVPYSRIGVHRAGVPHPPLPRREGK